MSNTDISKEKIQYSKILSSIFSSNAVVGFSILCLLNNLSLDIYSMFSLLKVVIPASFCFWFLGFVIGTILDKYDRNAAIKEKNDEQKAYEIPSMFADPSAISEDITESEELDNL